ncbi:MAG: polyprenyl synthetase family protein [Pseudomonadota bacterium]
MPPHAPLPGTHPARNPISDANVAEIARCRQLIDDRLAAIFDDANEPGRLACTIRHGLLSPGKRLRPTITLLACTQNGGDVDVAIDAACAVEMVHAASLIVDDLPAMDDAALRRGAVTTHTVFGEGTTILAAIAMLSEAYALIAASDGLSPERRLRCIKYLSDSVGINGLTGGQERDIMCGCETQGTKSIAEVEQRHREKTGALFSAAAAIGGEAAKADMETIDHLSDYGTRLGLAYQAFDDLIDIQCQPGVTGKDSDQDNGKSTVVSLMGEDTAARTAARYLDQAIKAAEAASHVRPAPLRDLALMIEQKFRTMTK